MSLSAALIAVALALLGVAGVLAGALWVRRRRARDWRTFAEAHGLRFVPSGWRSAPGLTGTWDGVPIEVRLARGEAARTVTWVAALFRVDLPKGLDIRSAAEAPTAGTEIPVGDPDLEATLRVCARDAADAQALLGSAHVLDALRAFATTGPAAAITGRRAICAFPGFLGDPEALAAALNRATRTVRAIEAARIWPSAARKSPEPEKSRAPEVVFHPRPAPAPEAGPAAGQRAPASISLVGHAIQTDEHTRARRARRS